LKENKIKNEQQEKRFTGYVEKRNGRVYFTDGWEFLRN
jgi:hypothetical protein